MRGSNINQYVYFYELVTTKYAWPILSLRVFLASHKYIVGLPS